ncbi:hypothetical protein MCOR17_011418, partial [Pyricularia oryzae]
LKPPPPPPLPLLPLALQLALPTGLVPWSTRRLALPPSRGKGGKRRRRKTRRKMRGR